MYFAVFYVRIFLDNLFVLYYSMVLFYHSSSYVFFLYCYLELLENVSINKMFRYIHLYPFTGISSWSVNFPMYILHKSFERNCISVVFLGIVTIGISFAVVRIK